MSATPVVAAVPQNLKGKVAIVAGASSGIGRETALELARRGAAVVLGARRLPELEKLVKEITGFGGKALAVKFDTTDEKDHVNLVQRAVQTFGGLHIAFNNAGTAKMGPLTDLSAADFEELFRVNVLGVFLGLKHQVPAMKASKGGVIINNSSAIGITSSKALPATAYAASKWAVTGLTENAACEVSDFGIRVVSINPGVTLSDMISGEEGAALASKLALPGFNKPILPIDIAKAVAFLASDDARFITATSLTVSGGMFKVV